MAKKRSNDGPDKNRAKGKKSGKKKRGSKKIAHKKASKTAQSKKKQVQKKKSPKPSTAKATRKSTTKNPSGKKVAGKKASNTKITGKKIARRKAAKKKPIKKAESSKLHSGAVRKAEAHKRTKKVTSKAAKKVVKKKSSSARSRVVKESIPIDQTQKLVYAFGAQTDGDGSMRALLGGKGANLAEMTLIGLPVPPGFTITTECCVGYFVSNKKLSADLLSSIDVQMRAVEAQRGKRFGDSSDPLLVSVRSGAAVSMPGMMDTILNLGLTDESVEGLAELTGNPRFAFDAYRRLIHMFGNVVMGVGNEFFESAFEIVKAKYGVSTDAEVSADGLRDVCESYKAVYQMHVGKHFPQDPMVQLTLAIQAVFGSWMSEKAISYRRIEGLSGIGGTAVNVQAMVFGNMGQDCGTGVAFTRNPSTGENKLFGEFLINAQGEDVVAGIRTPLPVSEMAQWDKKSYRKLMGIKKTLEQHYKDVQDIEFTVENRELFMLQTRTGKRTGAAAVKIACDLVRERLITIKQALLRVPAGDLTQLMLPSFDPVAKAKNAVLTVGLPASPGASVGHPAFSAQEVVERASKGEHVILVRKETSPEDVDGMHHAAGILTSTGGMTSHAAVVARGWGKCCVAGAGELSIQERAGTVSVSGKTFGRGDLISIDGSTGEVFAGSISTVEPSVGGDFSKLMRWADTYRTLGVRTNADTPEDALRARGFGAEGIGLTRTEHMFFGAGRIDVVRQMILALNEHDRTEALSKLLPMQRQDFVGIFTAMKGLPVTVRLLDPPLHEFLPHDQESVARVASDLGISADEVAQRTELLQEANPMMGHRGCRILISYPGILDMQVRAVVEAVIECSRKKIRAFPEIMIPLVGTGQELAILRARAEEVIAAVKAEHKFRGKLAISIGTMIEVPRAALVADEIAQHSDFFSFGTNDMTQLAFGYSRDDVNTFLPRYLKDGVLERDPFVTLDQSGVGTLVQTGILRGRAARSGLKIGVCGEHGGDPASVYFFHRAGLDYVSCSPFRVPIARLAAAQAALLDEMQE